MESIKFSTLFFLSFITFQSCNSDDNCNNSILQVTNLEDEYGCINTKHQMEIDLSEDFTIIRTQGTFDDLITGSCHPTIDFTAYDLVIGKKGLSTGNSNIGYELFEDCETRDLILKVIFHQNETTVAPNLTYHALIPKLGDEQGVNVEIEIEH